MSSQFPEGTSNPKSSNEYTLILRQVLMGAKVMPGYLRFVACQTTQKRTVPSGPRRNTAPRAFPGENWKLTLGSGPSTFTPNVTCASTWFPKKATFAQDLVRWQPVTRMISSIWSIPSPSFRAKASQLSICFTIHHLKSPCARVSSRQAVTGRDNTAAPRVLLY